MKSRRWLPTSRFVLLAWLVLSFFVQNDVGLADNGDYTRFMATVTSGPISVGDWPAAQTPEWNDRFFNYWLPHWRLDWPLHYSPTTVALFWISGALLNSALYSHDVLWLPLIGLPIKVALLVLCVALFRWIDTRAPRRRLSLTFVLAGPLILSLSTTDFVVYLNTFYREGGTVAWLLLFLATVLHLLARPHSWQRWSACLVAALLLTFAKASNVYWPLLWVPLLAWTAIRGHGWRRCVLVGVATVVCVPLIIVASFRLLADHTNVTTRYDNFFNSSLVVSDRQAAHLERLGMQDALRCIGVPRFVGVGIACFERYAPRMNAGNTVSVLLHEPQVVVRQVWIGLDNFADQSIEYQGIYAKTDPRSRMQQNREGPFDKRFWSKRSNTVLNAWSWARFHFFPRGWGLLVAMAALVGMGAVSLRSGPASRDLTVVAFLALTACVADMQVQVMGEGTQDLIRHLFLSNVLLEIAAIASVGAIVARTNVGAEAQTEPLLDVEASHQGSSDGAPAPFTG